MLADKVDYPFHLGVTEAGTPGVGTIKSAIGLGALLSEGIGDTIRVSLSADPTEEVRVGIDILKSLGLRKGGLTFVSCPSCGRADVDLVKLAKEVEDVFKGLNEEIHIAVMGCEVNGPGEARAADIGVAGGRGIGLIFKNGDVIRKVPEKEIVQAMREEVDKSSPSVRPRRQRPWRPSDGTILNACLRVHLRRLVPDPGQRRAVREISARRVRQGRP